MKRLFLSFIASLLLLNSPVKAAVPLTYTHHGVLREHDTLVNGPRDIKAEIVTDAGKVVGSSSGQVQVKAGSYTLEISDIQVAEIAAAKELKLQVSIDGEPLSPALKINAVPYASVAQMAKSLKTSDQTGSGIYYYSKDGEVVNDLQIEEGDRCPCDRDDNSWDCGETFDTKDYIRDDCYDIYGPAFQHYIRDTVTRPLEVVTIDTTTVGIGTTQPDAPLHILSDSGEDGGYDIHIADSNPRILLDDLDGEKYAISANNGEVSVAMVDESTTTNVIVLSSTGVMVNGEFNASTVSSDFKVSSSNITDGSIINDDIQDGTISVAKLDGLYPAKAFGNYAITCSAASICNQEKKVEAFIIARCFSNSSCSQVNITKLLAKNMDITRSGTGVYNVKFEREMNSADYAVIIHQNYGWFYSTTVTNKTQQGFTINFKYNSQSINQGTDSDGQTTYSIVNTSSARDVLPPATSCSSELAGAGYTCSDDIFATVLAQCNACRDNMLDSTKNHSEPFSVVVYE